MFILKRRHRSMLFTIQLLKYLALTLLFTGIF